MLFLIKLAVACIIGVVLVGVGYAALTKVVAFFKKPTDVEQ